MRKVIPWRPSAGVPLSNDTLDTIPIRAQGIDIPTYDRSTLQRGVVHIGAGNFHRAHQAVYFDDLEISAPADSAEFKPGLERIVYWGSGAADSLDAMMMKPGYEQFIACDTASDDVCLIAFTSGTTGVPKGTMHFQRDMLAICDTFGKYVLRPTAGDRFIGSPPIAFTFGLGGMVLFPLRVGAATVLLEKAAPDDLLPAIGKFRATVCFTAPTAYRYMLGKMADHDLWMAFFNDPDGHTLAVMQEAPKGYRPAS